MPTFSIVTPTFNSKGYLSETIDSVILQKGDFDIEYIIVDGGSVDGTHELVASYIKKLKEKKIQINCNAVEIHFYSEKDEGMYDALNKGFRAAEGQYHAWINSDDIYLPGAFCTVSNVFEQYPDVKWLKGVTSYISSTSIVYKSGKPFIYAKNWITQGVYGRLKQFIQQDSVFWKSELWDKVGGIDKSLRLAGDFYLWKAFSNHEALFSVNANFSCFRKVSGQLSSNLTQYRKEMDLISNPPKSLTLKIRIYSVLESVLPCFFLTYIGLMLFGKQTFYAIKVQSDGSLDQFSGSYCDINKLLLK